MYDIEGKLRRRAMLERLTGLDRADDATTTAAAAPPVPDQAPGPRHRNDPPADLPIGDALARRLLTPVRADLDHPIAAATEAALAVQAVPVEIAEWPEPVPAYEVVIPYQDSASRDDDPYAEASPYIPSRPYPGSPASQDGDDLPTAPYTLSGLSPLTGAGIGAAQTNGLRRGAHHPGLEPLEQAPPEPMSSAATIADLLRAGANKLFFDPDRPPVASADAIPEGG